MKKILLTILLLAIIGVVVYKFMCNKTPDENLAPNMQVKEIMESGGCLMCHKEGAKMPFYSNWPIAKKIIAEDVRLGLRGFDISAAYEALSNGGQIDQVSLAKIERDIEKGTMPPAKYYLVHWGSSISDKEKEMVMNWAKGECAKNYAANNVAPEFANEPIQPIPDSIAVDTAKVALGEALYYDTRLSIDSTVSCSSCHELRLAGTDSEQFANGVGDSIGGVNAPTVFNSVFNFVQFWDGRAATLADQAAGPPLNPIEMAHVSFNEIISRLWKDKEFTKKFLAVYPKGYSQATITDAIAEFEKTLITPNCKFDKYLKGDKNAMSANELEGYDLFKKYNCATCHVGVNMGGQSFEITNVFGDYYADRKQKLSERALGEDNGRYKETKKESDRHKFKVPSLRNIELTAPYYHDGTVADLNTAVNYMAKYQVNTILSQSETDKIVAFLKTLTGEYNGKLLTNEEPYSANKK